MRYPCHVLALTTCLALLQACNNAPPTWRQLLTSKIKEQFPAYTFTPTSDGKLTVHRPDKPDFSVDVNDIAQFCQRGPKDCNYATDQMLVQLRD